MFTKNRDRLLTTDIARKFLAAILAHKDVAPLLSDEHFSVDGTLVEAWASMKSFQPKSGADGSEPPAAGSAEAGQASAEAQACEAAAPAETPGADKGRNAEVNFHGQKRSNETHASVTDPDARLYRKGGGKEARLCYMGHALMENRNGLVVEACVSHANGHAERNAALAMIEPWADRPVRITLGADKGYDAEDFVNELKSMNVTPHVAAKAKGSAIDGVFRGLPLRTTKTIVDVYGSDSFGNLLAQPSAIRPRLRNPSISEGSASVTMSASRPSITARARREEPPCDCLMVSCLPVSLPYFVTNRALRSP